MEWLYNISTKAKFYLKVIKGRFLDCIEASEQTVKNDGYISSFFFLAILQITKWYYCC